MFIWLIGALIVLLLLLRRQKRSQRQERIMVGRARTTDLYQALYPILDTASRCCVDRILIRRDEVRIVLFKPMNSVCRFIFEERGFEKITEPTVLRVLALAISADMPTLRDSQCYTFNIRRDVTSSGEQVFWYEYNITPRHKDAMMKAWYNRPPVEDGIIR